MNIVFFDIDGTLAIRKDVPESAAKAVETLRANGNLSFICTGRNVIYARNNFHAYADGFICNNGRLAVLNDKVIFEEPIPKDTLEDIIKRLDELNAAYVFHSLNQGYYGGNSDGYEMLKSAQDPGYMHHCSDFSDLKLYNFDVWFKDLDQRHAIEKTLEGISLLNPHGPHPTADMTVMGCDKGDAIIHIAEKLNVPLENTYAFGDGINDLAMIKKAGHGVAMGNAVDPVKEAAEFITTDIKEDGVYNGLKHYQLI